MPNTVGDDQGAESRVQSLRALKEAHVSACPSQKKRREQTSGRSAYNPNLITRRDALLYFMGYSQLGVSERDHGG